MKNVLVQGAGGGIGGAIVRALLQLSAFDRPVATTRDPPQRPELPEVAEKLHGSYKR